MFINDDHTENFMTPRLLNVINVNFVNPRNGDDKSSTHHSVWETQRPKSKTTAPPQQEACVVQLSHKPKGNKKNPLKFNALLEGQNKIIR